MFSAPRSDKKALVPTLRRGNEEMNAEKSLYSVPSVSPWCFLVKKRKKRENSCPKNRNCLIRINFRQSTARSMPPHGSNPKPKIPEASNFVIFFPKKNAKK